MRAFMFLAERAGLRRAGSPARRPVGTGSAVHRGRPAAALTEPAARVLYPTSSQKQQGPLMRAFMFLAERAGFEPAEGVNPHTLSRRAT